MAKKTTKKPKAEPTTVRIMTVQIKNEPRMEIEVQATSDGDVRWFLHGPFDAPHAISAREIDTASAHALLYAASCQPRGG